MRIGYLIDPNKGALNQPLPTPRDAAATMEAMLEEGVIAEKAGFHSLQFPDRHGRTECYWPGPIPALTVLARETEKVALGPFTFVCTLYHPMHAAEQFAVIDNLSHGRLYTTLSRGYHSGYWQQFGIPEEKLVGRQLEFVEILQEAFKGERFSYDGKHYKVENGLLAPGPYQEGGWPIWVAATPPMRRCGARPATARASPATPSRSVGTCGSDRSAPTASTRPSSARSPTS